MRVHLKMLGCRLNQAEIDMMARQFQAQGHQVSDDPQEADHIIINTCAVTHDAVKTGRKLIRESHLANPKAAITVTGCHAQLAPADIQTLPGVTHVVDNAHKQHIVKQITGVETPAHDLEPIQRDARTMAWRTRAFVKVQDGCDNACTFCVTTAVRGAGRSRPLSEIIAEINALHAAGYQEAVLTGVHLGSYGHDLGDKHGLKHLVAAILQDTAVPRLRLSSLEPWDIAPNFFQLWQNPRLCPHLHLPLQSGCDATLKRMRRNTTQQAFRELMQAARASIPQLRVTTDIIVGFPQETDEEFAISEAFIHEMAFDGLHVFRYSRRPNTAAARMKGHIPKDVQKARSQRLLAYSQAAEARFAQAYLDSTLPVLWENVAGATPEGFVNVGYTHNYLRVQAVYPRVLTNHITEAHLDTLIGGTLHATPVIE